MKRRDFLKASAGTAAAAAALPTTAFAQDATFRFHSFLPPVAVMPSKVMKPFTERVAATSEGRINIQQFDSMALGGRPPELMDQARDGVADLVLTLPGYTPGRFPRTEVFDLPFLMKDPVATSKAFHTMVEEDFQNNEYADYKILAAWTHGPGAIHSKDPIAKLEDMKGKTLRGPTRVINNLLSQLGAEPVGMPVPAVPEALSKGVISGTVLPWEVTLPLRMTELVGNHTEFGGAEALYTTSFVIAMNKRQYESMDEDLRALLDQEIGIELAALNAQVNWDYDKPGRDKAIEVGNNMIMLGEAEVARWKEAAQPVISNWVEEMNAQDIDGQALIDRAQELIAQYSA